MNTDDRSGKPEALPSVASHDLLADELAILKVENERLKGIVRQSNADWFRLRDFIDVESPEEMCRFVDASRKEKGVQIFMSYLSNLWNERDKLKSANRGIGTNSV